MFQVIRDNTPYKENKDDNAMNNIKKLFGNRFSTLNPPAKLNINLSNLNLSKLNLNLKNNVMIK